jgi:hypothetical protein
MSLQAEELKVTVKDEVDALTEFMKDCVIVELNENNVDAIANSIGSNNLATIKTADDVMKAVEAANPNVKIDAGHLATIKDAVSKMLASPLTSHAATAALALSLAAASFYFGGPIGQVAAQSIYSKAFAATLGIPSKYSLAYWTVYWPNLMHFGNVGYQYGPSVLSALSAPAGYVGVEAVKLASRASMAVGYNAYRAGSYLGSSLKSGLSYCYNRATAAAATPAKVESKTETETEVKTNSPILMLKQAQDDMALRPGRTQPVLKKCKSESDFNRFVA